MHLIVHQKADRGQRRQGFQLHFVQNQLCGGGRQYGAEQENQGRKFGCRHHFRRRFFANDFIIESRKALKIAIFATQELGIPC